jgi:hypothetical protein
MSFVLIVWCLRAMSEVAFLVIAERHLKETMFLQAVGCTQKTD